MTATTIGQHLTIEQLRERFALREVGDEMWVVYKTTGYQNAYKPGDRAGGQTVGSKGRTEYRKIGMRLTSTGKKFQIREHVVVFALHHGRWPLLEIDHRDGNGLNNKPTNLREATRAQNVANTPAHRDSKLGIKGVKFDPRCAHRPYNARIGSTQNSTRKLKISSASFGTPEEASAWYQNEARKTHGEFAQ